MAINVLAVVAATILAFIFSSIWYVALAQQRARLSPAARAQARPPAWLPPVEILRNLVLALILAGITSQIHVSPAGALALALGLWVAFPVTLLSGSVFYEAVPWKLAAIHAGDWLGKLLIIVILVTLWR